MCIQVGNLEPATCYQYTVTVTNSQGTGQSSALSEEACTLPLPTTLPVTTATPQPDNSQMTPVIVASVVVGILLAVGLVVLFILFYCCCVRLRQKQKYNLPESDRRYVGHIVYMQFSRPRVIRTYSRKLQMFGSQTWYA